MATNVVFQNCMAFLLDTILEKPAADTPPKTVAPFSEFARSSVLITHRDLIELVRHHCT
jgi:hypothetical protein